MSKMTDKILDAKRRQEALRKQKELDKSISESKKKQEQLKQPKKQEDTEQIKQLNGLQRQIQLFGKTVSISQLQECYEFLKINQNHLIDVISWAINTIKNKTEVKEQDTDKQYYRNYLKWNEMRDYIRKF